MAMGLPPVTSAVFLVASIGKMWVPRRNISDVSATPLGIKREWYVYVCKTEKIVSYSMILSFLGML
jgi:hypothetical protein